MQPNMSEEIKEMSPDEEEAFYAAFVAAMMKEDGTAAQEHLAAGRPIYYGDKRYGPGLTREWPSGRKELVTVDESGNISVLRPL